MSELDCVYLKSKNKHERDDRVRFFEDGHLYYIDDLQVRISVTKFVHMFAEEFDSDAIIDKMMANKAKFEKGPYKGKTKEEIKQMWEDNRNDAADKGTKMHRQIELFYNQEPHDKESKEFGLFLEFHQKEIIEKGLIPFRTEMIVWSLEEMIAGSVDFMALDPATGEIVIFDWKRASKIQTWGMQRLKSPVDMLFDCNVNLYSLQLNTYKYILESYYGYKIRPENGMALVFLHPNQDSYKVVWVKDYQDKVPLMFKARLSMDEHGNPQTGKRMQPDADSPPSDAKLDSQEPQEPSTLTSDLIPNCIPESLPECVPDCVSECVSESLPECVPQPILVE